MNWAFLQELCALPGVSGREEAVREALLRRLAPACDCRVDPLGNLIAFKKGKKTPEKRRMFSAHMDEVGLIVTYLEEDGLVRFSPVGGIDRRVLVGKPVEVAGVPGVVGCKPIHLQSPKERDTAPQWEELFIDLGAASRQQAEQLVHPGDRGVFVSPYTGLGEGRLQGRALDDRVGCALLAELLLSDLEYDTWGAFTVQEETGTTGGRTAAAQILPERAVVLEATTACDLPDSPPQRQVCRLGEGPVVSFMDRGTVYSWGLYELAGQAAQAEGIRWQPKQGIYGGNEARSVQLAGGGVEVLAVSVPCRYLHTPSCVIQKADVEETARLLRALEARL
ncbi:MAG TPA: M42 family peptidase [Candidatus Anaerotruncus excrementipullorum]|uniref:M42 family peptidase n=1 Tax=Candidatus Anaerotruncus excrementipullorum TaxID=2838465 RepID=A0A9D2B7M8_9FIRM|nr:M42 family peptidase [Candidatus Anaerotruncus excrementipullorum]